MLESECNGMVVVCQQLRCSHVAHNRVKTTRKILKGVREIYLANIYKKMEQILQKLQIRFSGLRTKDYIDARKS